MGGKPIDYVTTGWGGGGSLLTVCRPIANCHTWEASPPPPTKKWKLSAAVVINYFKYIPLTCTGTGVIFCTYVSNIFYVFSWTGCAIFGWEEC